MTWNPIVGCSIASTGCAGCYAVPFAWRFMHHPNEAIAEKYKDTVRRTTAGQLVWTGRINFDEEALLAPLKRSEEHTSELQSLMRISYAVFCLKQKKPNNNSQPIISTHTHTKRQNYKQNHNHKKY